MKIKTLYGEWSLEDFLKSNRRLDVIQNGLWECNSDPPGAMHRWFCPHMFEQICVMDSKFQEMIKSFDGSEKKRQAIAKYLIDTCLRQYIRITVEKMIALSPALVDYFKALEDTKEWEEDKKEYSEYPNKGIETVEVKSEKFLI